MSREQRRPDSVPTGVVTTTLEPQRRLSRPAMIVPGLLLLAAVTAFVGRAYSLRFVQDDSYITYRYARHVVRGLGPVYNPGERVEGYTNFLWMLTLALFGTVGIPFTAIIVLSQVLGVLSGIGVIVIFFLLLRKFSTGPPELTPIALFLFAANGTFAYWCVSGMETGLFCLLLAAAFYYYLGAGTGRGLIAASYLLGLSALTRPEGALFFGIILLHFAFRRFRLSAHCSTAPEAAEDRISLRTGLVSLLLPFFIVVAPLYLWRLAYYGYLFPNTFYAKTGLDATSLRLGARYVADFYRVYGFWGLGLLIPVVVALRLRTGKPVAILGFSLLVLVIHSLYVVSVGGDVLVEHRFFVPLYVLFYFSLTESLWLLSLPRSFATLALVTLALLTFWGPSASGTTRLEELAANSQGERDLVRKMSAKGAWLNANTQPDDWFACTTIGAIGYFSDRNQVDMLGLTDAVVAHEPEGILGPRVYWKERRYNSRHVLDRNPAFICFPNGSKPSAAAERALFLRSRFRRGYFLYPVSVRGDTGILSYGFFKARPGADSVPVETPGVSPEFVDLYNTGINLAWAGKYDSAIAVLRRCIAAAPSDFAYSYERLGSTYLRMGDPDSARASFRRALAIDDRCVHSHLELGRILAREQIYDSAEQEFRAVVAYAPDYVDGYTDLSDILATAGRPAESESVLVACVSRFPGAADPALRLARLRLLSGNVESAVRGLSSLLALCPDNRDARSLLDSIGHGRRTDNGPGD